MSKEQAYTTDQGPFTPHVNSLATREVDTVDTPTTLEPENPYFD
jgi:hypothetical protein